MSKCSLRLIGNVNLYRNFHALYWWVGSRWLRAHTAPPPWEDVSITLNGWTRAHLKPQMTSFISFPSVFPAILLFRKFAITASNGNQRSPKRKYQRHHFWMPVLAPRGSFSPFVDCYVCPTMCFPNIKLTNRGETGSHKQIGGCCLFSLPKAIFGNHVCVCLLRVFIAHSAKWRNLLCQIRCFLLGLSANICPRANFVIAKQKIKARGVIIVWLFGHP